MPLSCATLLRAAPAGLLALALTATGMAASPAAAQQAPVATATPAAPTLTPAQAQQLRTLLPDLYLRQGLRHSAPPPLPADNAGLVRMALDYAHAVRTGRLDPSDFQVDWDLRPQAYDPLPDFARAVQSNQIEQWLRALPPPYPGYTALVGSLATYRVIEANGGWGNVETTGPSLREGDDNARIAALRARLAIEDNQVVTTGTTFDAALTDAVKRAQARYGLEQDGIAGPGTLRALNVPVEDRIGQIMANMERWRWLPRELPRNRIQVNIAAAVLSIIQDDMLIGSMRAVTGAPGHETPMLQSSIHSIVINPPWNVPTSIANNELWPRERRDPGYLARNGFRVISTGSGSRLQQVAGPHSSLGRFKFDFDNNFSVYLHDTPSQATFDRLNRLASHGCVRLARPAALAALLLSDDPQWTPETLQAAVDAGETVRVQLPSRHAVFLLYWTAYQTTDGRTVFLNDPYGWDRTLAAKIEARAQATAR